jgi:hypothetical protein
VRKIKHINKFIFLKIIFFQNVGGPMFEGELTTSHRNPSHNLTSWGYPPSKDD